MEQNLAQVYKDNLALVTQSLEQYKNEMAVFQKKYDMLRDDYQYNLEVIKERDDELKKYDAYVASMRDVQFDKCPLRNRSSTNSKRMRKHIPNKFKS